MFHIDLTEYEAKLLYEVLDSYLSRLRREIAGTDSTKWRRALKDNEDVISNIKNRLLEPKN